MTKIYGERAADIGADSFVLTDIDADGYADVLFGSPNNSPANRGTAGDLKVIYGAPDGFPQVIDTASPPPNLAIFQIIAPDPGDMFCYSLSHGDVDGDGFEDIVANAMGGDGNGNRHETAGDCYVISGRVFSALAGRGGLASPTLSRVLVAPDKKRYYAGESGIVLTLLSDAADPRDQFKPGAVAILRGVEVPTEFVDATHLRVRLDDAVEVRNQGGSLIVQARNAESGASAGVLSIFLIGPNLKKVRVKE
jgi:hypothetical protein